MSGGPATRGLVVPLLLSLAAGGAGAASAPQWVREQAALATPAHPDNCPAVVLLDRTVVRVDRDLTIAVRWQRAVRILTSAGVSSATFGLMLDPGGQVQGLDAWTLSAGGVRGSAGRGERVEKNVSDVGYSDVRTVLLSAPGARPGDVVAIEATWTDREPFPLHAWWPQPENLPTRLAELDIELPKDWSASAHGYHVAAELSPESSHHVHLGLSDLEMLPDEPSRPALSALLPHVVVRFSGVAGQPDFQRWEGVAAWYAQVTHAATAASACPAEFASSSRGSAAERLATLAALVQRDVRYVAIELGRQRWEPDPGAVTWQRRYGDCKDKAALLISALQAIGVEAHPLLVCTRSRSEVDPASPDPFQFNHCVVAIAWPGDGAPAAATVQGPSGRPWTVFDPTDTSVPLGFVSGELGGTWGVIADSREGLVRLPEASPSVLAITVAGQMDGRGDLRALITVSAEGPASQAILTTFGAVDPTERLARTRAYLASRWPQAALDSCRMASSVAGTLRSGIEMDVRLAGVARPAGGAWVFSPRLLSAWQQAPPRDSTRHLPIVLGDAGRYDESWDVELPEELVPESLAPIEWQGPIAAYSSSVSGGPGRVVLHRTLDLRVRQVPPDQYDQVRGFLRAVHPGDHPSVLLTRR